MRRNVLRRLQKRGDHFYFRAAVPERWRSAVKRREIKLSLVTADRATALLRCRVMSNAFDLLFRGDVLSKIPLDRIEEAAKTHFLEQLNKALELSLDIPHDIDLNTDDEINGSLERIGALRNMLRSLRFDRYVTGAAAHILKLAASDDPDNDELIYACKLAARSEIQTNNFLAQELSGIGYDGSSSDPLYRGLAPTSLPAPSDQNAPINETLAAIIAAYIDLKRGSWAQKTIADQRRSLSLAQDVIGAERLISTISTDDMRNIRDILLKVPKNALKSKSNSGKTLLEVVKSKSGEELISFKTREKYFSMIRGFFAWAVDEELIASFPGPKVAIPKGHKSEAISDRFAYSAEQLSAIFSSPLYRGYASHARRTKPGPILDRDGFFWVPLIAVYSGMRLGEIVQLHSADLKISDGIAYFDVTPGEADDDKTLKTEGSKRWVPVHPMLLSLGLLDHRAKILGNGKRLFEDILPDKSGYYSANFSKWWGRRTQALGIHTSKTVFHSFRHNFIDALRNAEVPDDVCRALVGHSGGGDRRDAHLRYGSKVGLPRLRAGVERVVYPEIDNVLHSII